VVGVGGICIIKDGLERRCGVRSGRNVKGVWCVRAMMGFRESGGATGEAVAPRPQPIPSSRAISKVMSAG
jgi:hypothetical protein